MSKEDNQNKRGYLNDQFRFFHLKDSHTAPIEYHYHDFQKIVIFFSGNVTYMVEGKVYKLMPWDILLINHHEMHKPIIETGVPYDRVILWLNRDYLSTEALNQYHLEDCFSETNVINSNLIRTEAKHRSNLSHILNELELSFQSKEYANELYTNTLFLQLMIFLNRMQRTSVTADMIPSIQSNQHVESLITYIAENLAGDLSIEAISNALYLSSSYLMHKFKDVTGTSLHSYITKKRLTNAIELMRNGTPITTASLLSGYSDYSTFLRTFRKLYHCTPTEYLTGKAQRSPFQGQRYQE